MSRPSLGRSEAILAVLAALLIFALLDFAWFDFSYTPVVRGQAVPGLGRPIYPTATATATQSPDGLLGVLAIAAALALLIDLGLEWRWPEIEPPYARWSRGRARTFLAGVIAAILAVKFLLHVDFTGYQSFSWGFYADAAIAGALLAVALWAQRMTSIPAAPG